MSTMTEEVTAIYEWAFRTKRVPANEVAAHYRIPVKVARERIKMVRRTGVDLPYLRPQQPKQPPKPFMMPLETSGLACRCGARFPLSVAALARHTVEMHHRSPGTDERTPVAA